MRPVASLEQAVPVGSPGHPTTAKTSHAARETRSRAGTLWEGTVEEEPTALLHGSSRS